MTTSTDQTQDVLKRFQAILNADLSEAEIEARIKQDFTEAEQRLVAELILGEIEMSESDRYFPE